LFSTQRASQLQKPPSDWCSKLANARKRLGQRILDDILELGELRRSLPQPNAAMRRTRGR
jgi:hypothetical protein